MKHKIKQKSGMVAHSGNPSSWGLRQKDHQFKVSLDYGVSKIKMNEQTNKKEVEQVEIT
jgi:hypothetical protein